MEWWPWISPTLLKWMMNHEPTTWSKVTHTTATASAPRTQVSTIVMIIITTTTKGSMYKMTAYHTTYLVFTLDVGIDFTCSSSKRVKKAL